MKQLTIREEGEFSAGVYNVGCEGFVDLIKGLFIKKTELDKRVEGFKNKSFATKYSEIERNLKEDLAKTYNDPQWVEKNLSGNSGQVTITALKIANINGVAITEPNEILKIVEGMFKVVEDIYQREKPFIERRIKLFNQIHKETDPKKILDFWSKHEAELKKTAADRYRQKTKTPTPALGDHYKKGHHGTWPINFENPKDQAFNAWLFNETDGSFVVPTPQNAASFVKAITRLLEIDKKLNAITKESSVPYKEFLEFDYSDVSEIAPVEDIYVYLTSAQSDYEVDDLACGALNVVNSVIVGLYIAMFDKHKKKE